MKKAILLFLVIFSTMICKSQEQEKFNVTGGIGLMELINLGGRFQFDQTELGFSIGTFPVKDESNLSLQTNVLYHFAGSSNFSNRRPWYLRSGLTYSWFESEYSEDKLFSIDGRIGRDFNISEKFGVQIDIGVIYFISHEEKEKNPDENYWLFWDVNLKNEIGPIMGITLYYRI